jgi:hypothetical protein
MNLDKAKHDTDKVNIYYSLSRSYWNKNADSALLMAQKSLDLAKKFILKKAWPWDTLQKEWLLDIKENGRKPLIAIYNACVSVKNWVWTD